MGLSARRPNRAAILIESIDRSCTSNAVFFSAKGGTFPDETPFAFEPGRDFRFIDGSERDVCLRRGRGRISTRRGVFFEVTRVGGRVARGTRGRAWGRGSAARAEENTRGDARSGRALGAFGAVTGPRARLSHRTRGALFPESRCTARARISRKRRCSRHHRDHGVRDRGQVRRALRPSFPRPRRFSRLRALRR